MAFSLKHFWDECRKADERKRRGLPPLYHPQWGGQWPTVAEPWKPPQFAESTIVATEWVMVFDPTALPAWLTRHNTGLEQVARERIEKRRGMSVEEWRETVGRT